MAFHGPSYGLDAELEQKRKEKYDPQLEKEVTEWVSAITGEDLSAGLHESLKSGVILCNLANILKKDSVKGIGKAKASFVMMENIGKFLEACTKFGLKSTDLFQTVDLYEAKNMNQVIQCLQSLGRQSRLIEGFQGPYLGPKISEKNERNFSDEVLKKGESVAPKLSLGDYGHSNQSGMYDTSRDIVRGPNAREKTMGKNN